MSTGRNFKKILEKMGGSEKAKPHSTKEGKVASGARRIKRIIEKQKPKTAQPTPMPKYTPRPTDTKSKSWITKKEKPKAWITKKEKPKAWITKKEKRPPTRPDDYRPPQEPQRLRDQRQMKKGGRANFRGGGRTNLLEELGRVEGEHSNKNRRAEVSRIHGELNKGYKKGGRSGYKSGGAVLKGKKVGCQIK